MSKTVAEVYAALSSKYGKIRVCERSECDVADLLMQLDEMVLSHGVLSFEAGTDKFEVYIHIDVSMDAGIWEQHKGLSMLWHM